VPRSLLVADLVGLSLAYFLTTLFSGMTGAFGSLHEVLVVWFTLPRWVIVAQLQGLYRCDRGRADHSTADDVVGVFHLVTIGVWVLLVASQLTGRVSPSIYALISFWAFAVCLLPLARTLAPPDLQARAGLRAQHADRRRRRGRPADRLHARQAF
jgi:hypothetical protein